MNKILIIFLALSCLGTTYVIKKGAVEVGRWSEEDGSDAVEVIENEVASKKQKPKILKDPEPITSEPGYAWTQPDRPEGDIAMWRVAGKVIDIITLKGIPPGGNVVFTYGSEVVKLPIRAQGFFRGQLPRFEKGGYHVSVEGISAKYDSNVELMKSGSFSKVPYKERLQKMNAIQFLSFDEMTVRENLYSLEVGLKPNQLSEKDQKAYYAYMREISGAPAG